MRELLDASELQRRMERYVREPIDVVERWFPRLYPVGA